MIEIPLTHGFGPKSQPPGDAVHDLLDREHALRPAETSKRRVGSNVRFRHLATDFDVRKIIRVVHVEHRAVGHRQRQIERPAAVGDQLALEGENFPFVVVACLEPGQERMPLPG